MIIKRRIDGTIRLSRYREFLWFVLITTLLGVASSNGEFGIRMVTVLIANWMAVAFMFMINDVEDAPDDALCPQKAMRNPISAGMLSHRSGWWVSILVGLLAGFLYLLLGVGPAVWGWIGLFLGYVYSWKRIRLKNFPIVDFLSHGMMLAGCQFLAAFYTFSPGVYWWWPFPFIMTVSISMYGELFNELRDFHKDREAGLTHTALLVGYQPTAVLMYSLLGIGVLSAVITLIGIMIVPFWVLVITGVLLICLLIPAIVRIARRARTRAAEYEPLHKPFEISFAVALSTYYVYPWLGALGARLLHWLPRFSFF
ncbi:MAG: UbiA family prenyltransferase [Anaerolineales bacterium]|nr:UbiA family prenyltransferase [Anaerolineales bacterium]